MDVCLLRHSSRSVGDPSGGGSSMSAKCCGSSGLLPRGPRTNAPIFHARSGTSASGTKSFFDRPLVPALVMSPSSNVMFSRLSLKNCFALAPGTMSHATLAMVKWPMVPQYSGSACPQSRTRSTSSRLQTVLRNVASTYDWLDVPLPDRNACPPHCSARGRSIRFSTTAAVCAGAASPRGSGARLLSLAVASRRPARRRDRAAPDGSSSHSVPESPG